MFSRYATATLCNFLLQNEKHLTCTLRSGYIGTGLVPEEKSAIICTGIDIARWIRACAMTTVIRKGHGSAKRAGYRGCFLAEHGVQQRIPRNIRAERRQGVSTVTVSCKKKLIDVNSHVPIITTCVIIINYTLFLYQESHALWRWSCEWYPVNVRKSDNRYWKVIYTRYKWKRYEAQALEIFNKIVLNALNIPTIIVQVIFHFEGQTSSWKYVTGNPITLVAVSLWFYKEEH
jgi:hypothetical protein